MKKALRVAVAVIAAAALFLISPLATGDRAPVQMTDIDAPGGG
jgi:hypothetical protein